MRDLTLTAIGEDRPGIVAAVTGVLYELGCNLADCSMSLLRGQFAMILLIEAPEEVTAESLEQAIAEPAGRLALVTTVREVPSFQETSPARPFVLSLYGADRPGIVHRVSRALANRKVNITDLVSHLAGVVYTMVLEVDLPSDLSEEEVISDLAEISSDLEVDFTFRSAESDQL